MLLGGRAAGRARLAEVPSVVTVTLTDAGWEPSSVTELEESEQVEWAGAPLQLSWTVWLNPPCGATETINLAVWPGVTVALEDEEAASEKSGAVSLTTVPVPGAPPLSVVPYRLPALSMTRLASGSAPSPFSSVKL
jgi:hypothetical protein